MANNDDYHGLEMYKNHAKDSLRDICNQTQANQHGKWPNQSLKSQGNSAQVPTDKPDTSQPITGAQTVKPKQSSLATQPAIPCN